MYVFAGEDIVFDGDFWSEFAEKGKFDQKGRFLGFREPIVPRYRLKNAEEKIAEIDSDRVEPVDAEVRFCPENPAASVVIPEQKGWGLDREKLLADIERALAAGQSYTARLRRGELRPEITTEDARRSLNLCTTFSTDLGSSSANRWHNVALALSRWNGKSFRRGETGSFNDIVGARTAQAGFRDAKVIENGEFIDGIGGGVCQASTTVYNAVLLSGNTVTEKHRHTLRVGYVAPSFDAMVSSACDMKFRCDKKLLHIVAGVVGNRAEVKIYAAPNEVSVTAKSVIVKEGTPPPCEEILDSAGQYADKVFYEDETFVLQASKGELRSEGWLIYGDGRREKIRSDVYRAQTGKLVRGVHPRPQSGTDQSPDGAGEPSLPEPSSAAARLSARRGTAFFPAGAVRKIVAVSGAFPGEILVFSAGM